MNVILLSPASGRTRRLDLGYLPWLLLLSFSTLLFLAGVFYAGYEVAARSVVPTPEESLVVFEGQLDEQAREISEARRLAQEKLDALSVRLGQMQAHVIRLDALGRRLTGMAGLEDGEFDFSIPPAQGGPEPGVELAGTEVPDVIAMLGDLDRKVSDRERQLAVLENMLMDRNLREQVHPAGRPVKSGYISSFFGMRTDPFTGRKARHKGVDFAGRDGAEVVAVAAGVVTWSDKRFGFGKLVEINHGNGFVTRYAHNRENLVAVGDRIEKGQIIALMGSTGRATGPNLHFEVLRDGKVVNPLTYVEDNG